MNSGSTPGISCRAALPLYAGQVNASDLNARLRSASPPLLIHVLPAEIFAARSIPSSRNACVYEMGFLDQIQAFVPGPFTPLIVYGAGDGSLDAAAAAEKL